MLVLSPQWNFPIQARILLILKDSIDIELADATCVQCKQIPTEGLKRCGACHVTMYCGKSCQIRHWREGGHKKNCPGKFGQKSMRKPFITTNIHILT